MLTSQEEGELVDWILLCAKRGFPITKAQLLESVRVICVKKRRINPFTNNTPGRSWYEFFMKRHQNISERVAENVCLNRAKLLKKVCAADLV